VVTHLDATATTSDLRELAETVSGQDLEAFFAAWVYAEEIPTRFP
jgi:aminopeptidase N